MTNTPSQSSAATNASAAPSKPYSGMRVLDLTRVLASPFASYMLALLGADVLKIEHPQGGDPMRTRAPGNADLGARGMGTGFISQNANKKSLTLDLRTPEGQEIFRKLAAEADVLVENLRTGTMDSYGLGYDALHALNPRLIYCSVTGYGHTGEKARHPAYDPVIQAAAGVMNLTQLGDSGPVKAGIPAIDYATGMAAAFGISSALLHRERAGIGQHVDVSMLDTALVLMSSVVTDVLTLGSKPKPIGNRLGSSYGTNQTYRIGDGLLWISAPEEHQQDALWKVLEREDIPADPRFASDALRAVNVAAVTAEIEATLTRRPVDEWEWLLNEAGVPAMRVRTINEALDQEQLKSRGLFHHFDNVPGAEIAATVAMLPFGMSETPAEITLPPPRHSEHSEDVLRGLGYSAEAIASFRAKGVV